MKVGAETHLGGGDMSAFVSPLAAIARALSRLPVAVLFLGKAHEDSDHAAVIAVQSNRQRTGNPFTPVQIYLRHVCVTRNISGSIRYD